MSDHHTEHIRYGQEIGWSTQSLRKAINVNILNTKVNPESFEILFSVIYQDTVTSDRLNIEIIKSGTKSNTIIITI